MTVEKQNQLFDRNSKTTYGAQNETDVGLGLVLCKEFAELRKESINLINSENKGSTFTVCLPIG
jgi:signal transduction histidine kinase